MDHLNELEETVILSKFKMALGPELFHYKIKEW